MISIVITTFNAATFIIETLDSIRYQTYQQFEIIVVDDGSTDETLKIIKDYILRYPSIHIYVHAMNHIGRASALNYAISQANRAWIAIIDADDVWHTKKLELQVKYITKYNLDFLATKARLFYRNDKVDIFDAIDSEENQLHLNKIQFNSMLFSNLISHSSVVAKRKLINYNFKRKSQVDYEMWLRLLESGVNMYLLNLNLVYHRIHPQQSFEAKNKLRYITRTIMLQLSYAIRNLKIKQTLFILFKIGYYLFLPKNIRLRLRECAINIISYRKSSIN